MPYQNLHPLVNVIFFWLRWKIKETSTFCGIHTEVVFPHWDRDTPTHPVTSSTGKESGSPMDLSKVKTAVAREGEPKQSPGWQRDMAYFSLSKIKMGIDLSWGLQTKDRPGRRFGSEASFLTVCRLQVPRPRVSSSYLACSILLELFLNYIILFSKFKQICSLYCECI